ncbi:MAG: metallophosphoesterase family protein, partial [Ignisphaera sp.]
NPLYGYMKPDLPLSELRLSLTPSMVTLRPSIIRVDTVIAGHTHIPMDIAIDGVRIVNPGSCGQPRDGDFRASYAIYNTETNTFEIHRVEYNIERVIEKLRELKLDERYVRWLTTILKTGRVQPP